MRITRLPRDPGPAGWNAILPEAPPASPLRGAATADWLIIGAGFAGLAAARRLSQLHPGATITVLDATRIAAGPAGRNSGFMVDLPHDLTHNDYTALGDPAHDIAINRCGIAFAAQAAEEYGLSDEAFTPSGKVNAAASAKGSALNATYVRHLTALGEPFETLDAAAMARLTGTDYYRSGVFTPGTAVIQPALFVPVSRPSLRVPLAKCPPSLVNRTAAPCEARAAGPLNTEPDRKVSHDSAVPKPSTCATS